MPRHERTRHVSGSARFLVSRETQQPIERRFQISATPGSELKRWVENPRKRFEKTKIIIFEFTVLHDWFECRVDKGREFGTSRNNDRSIDRSISVVATDAPTGAATTRVARSDVQRGRVFLANRPVVTAVRFAMPHARSRSRLRWQRPFTLVLIGAVLAGLCLTGTDAYAVLPVQHLTPEDLLAVPSTCAGVNLTDTTFPAANTSRLYKDFSPDAGANDVQPPKKILSPSACRLKEYFFEGAASVGARVARIAHVRANGLPRSRVVVEHKRASLPVRPTRGVAPDRGPSPPIPLSESLR